MSIIRKWFLERQARLAHEALVEEARSDWRVVKTHRQQCYWSDVKQNAGYWVFVAEENGLGERRVRVVSRPEPPWPKTPTSELWASLKEWEARAERKSIPRKEIA